MGRLKALSNSRLVAAEEAFKHRHERVQPKERSPKAAEPTGKGLFRRSHSEEVPEEQTQVLSQGSAEQPLGQFLASSQGRPTQTTMVE
jgi:hypothetical protein